MGVALYSGLYGVYMTPLLLGWGENESLGTAATNGSIVPPRDERRIWKVKPNYLELIFYQCRSAHYISYMK